jgi:hypothetical protein
MSPKIPSLAAGLTALGLSWSGTFCLAQAPSVPAPSAAPATEPGDVPSSKPTVLLLSNGDVLQGEISEDDRGFIVKVKLGDIRRARRDVEAVFSSLHEAYEYKAKRLAPRDPDEHMNLARWCLRQELNAEAMTELKGVLELDPSNNRAKDMLFNVENTRKRGLAPPDKDVQRTGGESIKPDVAGPRDLNIANVREQAKRKQALGPPVILDLPPAVAIRRYQDFAHYVHPQLQKACASCHNEQSGSSFQLVPALAKRDYSNELLIRANLDSVMRLVNPNDPAHSELLRSAIMPHPPTNKPVLHGPNDPAYRNFSIWVNSLRTPDAGRAPGATGVAAANSAMPSPSDGFASGRSANSPMPGAGATQPSGALAIGRGGATSKADDREFKTVSPLISPENSPPIQVGASGARVLPGGIPASVATGADGKQVVVPLGPDGKPIPEAPRELPKDRKPKNFNLDASELGKILNKSH